VNASSLWAILQGCSRGMPLKSMTGGWSQPATTNALVEDETVEAVLGMNQKHILPCPKVLIFSTSSLPQNCSLLPMF